MCDGNIGGVAEQSGRLVAALITSREYLFEVFAAKCVDQPIVLDGACILERAETDLERAGVQEEIGNE